MLIKWVLFMANRLLKCAYDLTLTTKLPTSSLLLKQSKSMFERKLLLYYVKYLKCVKWVVSLFSTKMLKLKKRSQTQRAARIKMLVQARRHGDNLVADGGARLNNFSDVGLTNPTDHLYLWLSIYLLRHLKQGLQFQKLV